MTSNPADLSEEEIHNQITKLHQELDRRRVPSPLLSRGSIQKCFVPIYDICVNHIKFINGDGGAEPEKDLEHFMYEAVMEAVYGDGIWNWINKQ